MTIDPTPRLDLGLDPDSRFETRHLNWHPTPTADSRIDLGLDSDSRSGTRPQHSTRDPISNPDSTLTRDKGPNPTSTLNPKPDPEPHPDTRPRIRPRILTRNPTPRSRSDFDPIRPDLRPGS
uniref:Uncharacterized protein n=1 Tax=Solanum demissum TaxID=50514 RepID=Q6L3Z1_SOLDE|nr:hypothetical protein SDM1_46t00009 [Solanum demissum]